MLTILRGEQIHAFRNLIIERCGEDVGKCIQCGKCSSGCPVASEMKYIPNQIMELIRLNQEEKVLTANTFWFCAGCQTCSIRCPHDIDIALVMNTLRKLTLDKGYPPADRKISSFNTIFTDSIKQHGRVYELGMVTRFNLTTGQPLKDAGFGPTMLRKGKLGLLPHRIKGLRDIREIFRKSKKFT